MISIKNICYILVCIMFVSCKQSIFLNRKYTDGFYFSKTGSVDVKKTHKVKTKNTASTFSDKADVVMVKSEPLTDTIILNSGRKVTCKVKTVERKKITYTDGQPGPTGTNNKIMRNKNIARIHFNGGQKNTSNNIIRTAIQYFSLILFEPENLTIGARGFGYILIM
ncbi:MAG: hypothetical protein IPG08_14900 [Sphingobacteriaceae bacterium]|nr:hypothetical protein [Sphingobacteriaceae bacterium]